MPSEYSTMHEIISSILFNMDRRYSDYIDIIDEVENIEQVVITDSKCKKVCFYTLELIKLGIQYIKMNM